MLNRFDFEVQLERRRDELAYADHARMVAACEQSGGLARRAARPLGRVLSHIGERLLSYADTRSTSTVLPAYHHPSRTSQLH